MKLGQYTLDPEMREGFAKTHTVVDTLADSASAEECYIIPVTYDDGQVFLEVMDFAHWGMYDDIMDFVSSLDFGAKK